MNDDRTPLELETGDIVLGIVAAVLLLSLLAWLVH